MDENYLKLRGENCSSFPAAALIPRIVSILGRIYDFRCIWHENDKLRVCNCARVGLKSEDCHRRVLYQLKPIRLGLCKVVPT